MILEDLGFIDLYELQFYVNSMHFCKNKSKEKCFFLFNI